jgi:predicted MFS family arabinose efflux permease
MDVVIDGITCIQQKNDPKNGAEDVQTFAQFTRNAASISGSLFGGLLAKHSQPQYAFYIYGVVSLICCVSSYKMGP